MKNITTHIIGAGISGLGSAHFLQKRGFPSIVYESQMQAGGRAGYVKWENGFFETGGKNFADSWSDFFEIQDDLGISERDQQHGSLHLLLDGKLKKFDKRMGLSEIINMMRYVGVTGSLQLNKIIRYKVKNSRNLNFDGGLISELERAYDHAPVTHHFHRKLCKGPLRMFSIIGGGAEPEETYFSNLMHVLPFGIGKLNTFSNGIGHFFETLSQNHKVRFNTTVKEILIEKEKVTGLWIHHEGEDVRVDAEHVLCSLPLHQFAKLIKLPDHVADAVRAVRYFPVALINAEYEDDVFDQHCQSIMFDERYHLGHCSANRSYKLNSVRFTVSGRKGRSILHLPDEELVKIAEEEFSTIRPIRSPRVRYHVQKHLGGMCAYGPMHTETKKVICDFVKGIEGLEIAGDYLEGHNMGHCLVSARKATENIINSATNGNKLRQAS